VGAAPTVAVVIPTFNRAAFLASCLDSVLAQTLTPTQVIVVVDGSTDGTAEVLERYVGAVELLSTSQQGKSHAVNAGLDRVRSDYVWILDDDDLAFPDALERFVQPLESGREWGFSYSTMCHSRINECSGAIDEVIRSSKVPSGASHDLLLTLLRTNFLGGAALFTRASVYDEVGRFDATLVRSQDYEMAIRIARRFRGVQVRGGPTFHYRQHDGPRGPLAERFPAAERREKWLEYDRRLFRRLRDEISLDELVPSGPRPGPAPRSALLQRAAIMASKLLVDEALVDLERALDACGRVPLTPTELDTLRLVLSPDAVRPKRGILDEPHAVASLRAISSRSPLASSLRREIRRARALRAWRRHAPRWRRRIRRVVAPWVGARRGSARAGQPRS
jgi:glycosyltransferase involved in cell wall biosynthesis